MNKPKLVNIKRTKNFDLYIGRWNPAYKQQASKWHNPDKKAREKSPEIAKAEFQEYVRKSGLSDSLGELEGKTLACYCCQCKSKFCSGACPCHGNWLIEMMGKQNMINWIFVSEPPVDASLIDEISLLELLRVFPQGENLSIFSMVGLPERVAYKDCVPKFQKKFVRFTVSAGEKMTIPIYWRK